MGDKYLKTLNDSYIYKTLSEALGDKGSQLLDILLKTTYQKSRSDLAKELRPEVIVRHGVFANNREKGIEKIRELVGNKPVILGRYGKHEVKVTCIDSEYQLLPFNDGARGHKLHYAYVDEDLLQSEKDMEMLNCRIKPMLVLASIHFGNEEGFNHKNHLIYFK